MPPDNSTSKYAVPDDRASELDRDSVEWNNYTHHHDTNYTHHHDTNYTSSRPPHLNDENFSSTQPGGSTTHPRTLTTPYRYPKNLDIDLDLDHVTENADTKSAHQRYAPSSANTEGTLKRGDPFQRPDLSYLATCDFGTAAEHRLTEQAIAAHDYLNKVSPYDGNIDYWMSKVGIRFRNNETNDSNSYDLMPPGPRSHTSRATTVPSNKPQSAQSQYLAQNVYAIGGWSEISADPDTVLAGHIRDEDVPNAQ
ncbi:hypothetical protein GGR54DRAFT_624558 [Hypoxylon sp. NC1633]|nr:hypothetical protein GGR54DRAFT_624558 [Hypoxylon sp. NC1633]